MRGANIKERGERRGRIRKRGGKRGKSEGERVRKGRKNIDKGEGGGGEWDAELYHRSVMG